MIGFELDFWDYATFVVFALAGAIGVACLLWLAGLPGRIAIKRKHPEAEAVQWMGYAGLLPTIYPWIQAFIWAFKPTDVIDIRRFPKAEAEAIERENDRLRGKPAPDKAPVAVKQETAGQASKDSKSEENSTTPPPAE